MDKAKFKYKYLYKYNYNLKNNSINIFSDDYFYNPSLSNMVNFSYYNNDMNFEALEDSYENIKNLKHIYLKNYKNSFLNLYNYSISKSYTNVLDSFRAGFDEQNWNFDYEYNLEDTIDKYTNNSLNLTNSMKIRSTAKNSIVTYNAIQKVFKSRFDDSRSNANFKYMNNSFVTYPFITDSKTPYESMIGKNKESFYNINFYNYNVKNNYSVYLDS
jgi:hypothetical protein